MLNIFFKSLIYVKAHLYHASEVTEVNDSSSDAGRADDSLMRTRRHAKNGHMLTCPSGQFSFCGNKMTRRGQVVQSC